jgi:DNA-binding transcriptional LysR family regulator
VMLQFRPMLSGEQLPAVRNRAVDIAFLTCPLSDEELECHVVQKDRLVAVLPDDHRLAGEPASRYRD